MELREQPAHRQPLPAPEPTNGDQPEEQIPRAIDVPLDRSILLTPVEPQLALQPAEVAHRLIHDLEIEPIWKRWLFLACAVALCWGFFYFTNSFWAPAHHGNNQNGYLAGAKLLATRGTTGFEPRNPFQFVGWMWNMADEKSTAAGGGMHYPKYPLGVPMIDAIVYRVGLAQHGEARAVEWVYLVNPIAMSLALLGTFFAARLIAGSFAGLLAIILLGTCPLVLSLTNNPNSHALSLFFLCWGFYFLAWWTLARGGMWTGILGGFLLGYAVTIRYTEGLMLLPLGVACLLRVRWRDWRSYWRAFLPVGAWAAPVVLLVLWNIITVGTLTGYDATNESSGFTWDEFQRKWRYAVDQLYNTGLFFVLPVGVTGLALAFKWNWRAALLLTLWFIPGTLLYMSYYYGMNMPLIGYLRFFTSMIPPIVIAAVWFVHRASNPAGGIGLRSTSWWARGSIAAPIAAGVFVFAASAMNAHSMLGPLERDFTVTTRLADVTSRIRESIPSPEDKSKPAIIFGHSQRLLNHLQFAGGNYELYGADYFRNGSPVPNFGNRQDGEPNPIQKARREFLRKAYEGKDNQEMVKEQRKIMENAFANGQRVFVVLESSQYSGFRRTFLPTKDFETVILQKWTEPVKMSPAATRTLAGLADGTTRGTPQSWTIAEVKPKAKSSNTAEAEEPKPKARRAAIPTTQPNEKRFMGAAPPKATEPSAAKPDAAAPPQPQPPLQERPASSPASQMPAPATQPSTQPAHPVPSVKELINKLRGR